MLQRPRPACSSGGGLQAPEAWHCCHGRRPRTASAKPALQSSPALCARLCAAFDDAVELSERQGGSQQRWQRQQDRQQQQQQQGSQQQARTRRGGLDRSTADARVPEGEKKVPGIVRVQEGNENAVASNIQGAAGSLVKRLEKEDLVRVVAADEASIWRTMIVLLAADNMLRANIGHMIVWQPLRVGPRLADPPDVPEGAYVFYAMKLLAGDVLTDNSLAVGSSTDPRAVGGAILARVCTHAHTVVECLGSAANTAAVKAIGHARKGLLGQKRDCAVVLSPQQVPSKHGDRARVLLNRLVLLECEVRNCGRLQLQASVVER